MVELEKEGWNFKGFKHRRVRRNERARLVTGFQGLFPFLGPK